MELSPEGLSGFFATVMPHLDERRTRVVAGAMVAALGRGGQARVVEARTAPIKPRSELLVRTSPRYAFTQTSAGIQASQFLEAADFVATAAGAENDVRDACVTSGPPGGDGPTDVATERG